MMIKAAWRKAPIFVSYLAAEPSRIQPEWGLKLGRRQVGWRALCEVDEVLQEPASAMESIALLLFFFIILLASCFAVLFLLCVLVIGISYSWWWWR